eukprot:gb/GECG01015488.1/.p1 GENE.gb/GECG01015488.1/~~gb/GECG01015488.1/.p1  ORF type:complete len:142 (+),score=16.04 gb/GECG01015488.1/:1-426(+)
MACFQLNQRMKVTPLWFEYGSLATPRQAVSLRLARLRTQTYAGSTVGKRNGKKDKPQIDSEMLHDSSSRHANHRRGSESLMQEVVEKRPASEKIKIAESKMWKRKQKQKNLLKKIVEHEYFGPVCIMLLATCLFVYWLIKL